jgi:hypothetical protein
MKIVWALLLVSLAVPASLPAATAVPLSPISGFVPNRGQAPPHVLYQASFVGGAIYLMRGGIIIDSWEDERAASRSSLADVVDEPLRRRGRSVQVRFVDADAVAVVENETPAPTRLNYFIGSDPSGWHPDVPVYGRVVYRELWPGVDLAIGSASTGVTCALEGREGANIGAARFELDEGDGARATSIDVAELTALLASAGVRAKRDASPVSGARSNPTGESLFDNPATLNWSTFLGATAEEIGWSATLDSQGNPVVTGLNTSTFFPTTPGAYDRVYSGLGDVFVAKFSADGATLLWSTFLGGDTTLPEYGYSVIVDAADNPIVTGHTRSENFPTTPGAYDTDYNLGADAFVSKLSSAGNALLWSTYLGGFDHDLGYDVDLDASGNPVVAGRALSPNFPTTLGAYDRSPNGEEDGFITKLRADGSALIWSTFLGGSLYDGVQAIELDAFDAPIVCGYMASLDFPGGGADGLYDVFVTKLSSAGSGLSWSRVFGGSSYDYCAGMDLDSMGNPVICGSTGSFDFPVTAGAYDVTYNGDDDVIAAKLSGVSGATMWATFVGGSAPVYEIARGVALDFANRPILAGATPSADFPTTPDGFDTSHNGASDVFVVRLDAAGSALDWGSFFGGPVDDYGFAIASDGAGDVVVTGSADTGFPVTPGAYDITYNGDISDVFVARVTLEPDPTGVEPAAYASAHAIAISPNPVAGEARITFSLPVFAPATNVEIFDMQGRRRGALRLGPLGAGPHSVEWSALDSASNALASGVYAVRVTSGAWTRSARAVLLR